MTEAAIKYGDAPEEKALEPLKRETLLNFSLKHVRGKGGASLGGCSDCLSLVRMPQLSQSSQPQPQKATDKGCWPNKKETAR